MEDRGSRTAPRAAYAGKHMLGEIAVNVVHCRSATVRTENTGLSYKTAEDELGVAHNSNQRSRACEHSCFFKCSS
jgi:hypothetical protein